MRPSRSLKTQARSHDKSALPFSEACSSQWLITMVKGLYISPNNSRRISGGEDAYYPHGAKRENVRFARRRSNGLRR